MYIQCKYNDVNINTVRKSDTHTHLPLYYLFDYVNITLCKFRKPFNNSNKTILSATFVNAGHFEESFFYKGSMAVLVA